MNLELTLTALTLLSVRITSVAAQNSSLIPNPSWRKPTIAQTWSEQVEIARRALDKAVASLNATSGLVDGSKFSQASDIYNAMSQYDYYTGQTIYKSRVLSGLTTVGKNTPQFQNSFLGVPLQYGIACIRAYRVYGDQSFLDLATEVWQFATQYTITPSGLSNPSLKNMTIDTACQQVTMAGGTFWNTDINDPTVTAGTTGRMFVLSALLAEATAKQEYLQAASRAGDFVRSHLYSIQDIVQDHIAAKHCAPSGPDLFSYNAGLFIEGAALVGNMTSNSTLSTWLRATINSTLDFGDWQSTDGISTTASGDLHGDPILFRGLNEVYVRNPLDADLRSFVRKYLSVQYNAILDLSGQASSDIYGGFWRGPPYSTYDVLNQTNAAVALVEALALGNDISAPSPISSPSVNSTRSKPSLVGPIVGGVIGGVILIVILCSLICMKRRKSRHNRNREMARPSEISPFPTTNSTASTAPHRLLSKIYSEILPSEVPLSSFAISKSQQQLAPTSQTSGVAEELQTRRPPDDLPTAELVRVLNDRLRTTSHWEDGEAPPVYGTI